MKTFSSSKFVVQTEAQSASTRLAGVEARHRLLEMLEHNDVVEVDLSGVSLTPSFADELFGVLWVNLGAKTFSEKVCVSNINDSNRALLNHVVRRRSAEFKSVLSANSPSDLKRSVA